MRNQKINLMRCLAAALLLPLCWTGCGEHDAVQVKLQARSIPRERPIFLKINAQVAGPTDNLHYKWFAVSGECTPQESDAPDTVFKFAEGVRQDRVSVEVWRDNSRVAQTEIKVKFDDEMARLDQTNSMEVHIAITNIPPAELGGPDTHADIAGTISGKVPSGYLVALYARAYGAWYVQPESGHLHPIKSDNSWGTWTHTGAKYAALLVRPDFEPVTKLDMLPETNEQIIAIDMVDGRPGEQLTNAASGAPPAPH